jgi:DNA-binding NarL/FixJ family response regulator
MSVLPKEPSRIKVIIADDHPVFRKGIVTTLKHVPFIMQTTQAANGEEVLDHLKHEMHDVVLMDIRMAPLDGIQTTEMIRKKYPSVKIIALSSFDDEEYVISIMQKGASGYLLKNADRKEIITAIETVLTGHTYYSKEIELIMHDSVDQKIFQEPGQVETRLSSPVAREIIFLICNEFANKEIAQILNRSYRTIESYRADILKLTNSTNSIGIHKYALKRGIMEDPKLRVKFKKVIEQKKIEGK